MFIGEIAAEAGVSVQTVRFYERRGLMRRAVRSASGYRHYEPVDLDILKTIAQCQSFGFTLAEIRDVLRLFWVPDPKTGRPRHKPNETQCMVDACEIGVQKLAALDTEIARMQQSRDALTQALHLMRMRIAEQTGAAVDSIPKDRPQTSSHRTEEHRMKIRILALAGLTIAASAQAGTIEANKAVATRVFNDIYNRHDFAAAQEIYAPGFVNHGETRDTGIEEDQAATHGWVAAFPNLHVSIDKEIAEGDLVTVLWTGEGTNTGNGNGFNATGAHLKMRGITIWRVVDGKLAEEWSEFNERAAAERGTQK